MIVPSDRSDPPRALSADVSSGVSPEVALHHALADELVMLTRTLSDLAYDLGTNPATLRAHMKSLQSIDRMTQAQLAIADLLRSDQPVADRVRAITLESLADDLARRLALD